MPNTASARFFTALNELVRSSEIIIDRPTGKPHPRIPKVVYPLDYGYLEGTTSSDGEGIDVFVGSATGGGVTGVLLTADVVKRDAEIKVLVDCTPHEIEIAQGFLNRELEIGGISS